MFAKTRAAVRNSCSKGNYMKGIYWGPYNVSRRSILIVTLSAIKINSITQTIPNDIHAFQFVDELQMAYSSHSGSQD